MKSLFYFALSLKAVKAKLPTQRAGSFGTVIPSLDEVNHF